MQEGLVGGEGVVGGCRVRVLGGEPVVDGDDRGAGAAADLRGQGGGLEGVPDGVHAAVEVQDDVAGLDCAGRDLGGGDAAQFGCGHGHAGGQWLRRCQFGEQSPLLADVAADGECCLPQDCVEGLLLLGAHEGAPLVGVGLAALPGEPATSIRC